MKYYLAPMEGLTTYVYRNAYAKYFGGIDKYFTPFLASMHLNNREKAEVNPENNKGITVVPQILGNKPDEFIVIAKTLQSYGYECVNLNLGCPSGTVAAKHRGAGFLAVPKELDAYLYEIFDKCPIHISIKTRIGIAEEEEWEKILAIYSQYPIEELIIHTRVQKDFYRQPTRPHTYTQAAQALHIPLCYNGDIVSRRSLDELQEKVCDIDRIMLGRGLITNPNLPLELQGQCPKDKETYRAFIEEIFEKYNSLIAGGDKNILYKMKEIWVYMGAQFEGAERYVKRIKKANHTSDYEQAVRELFRECELKDSK